MKTERNGKILPFRYVHCPRCGEQLLYQVEPINGTIKVKCCECKAIAFGDFSYYWIADRQNRIFKKLSEHYAANGQVGFIGTQRVDGKLILPEAVKRLKMKASA